MAVNYNSEWEEQASAPANPGTGNWKIFFKADGLYLLEDNGTVHGPFSATTTGAHAASHLDGGADAIDGDKLEITWTPTNYTRDSTTPAEADSDDDLTAHLQGVDTALVARLLLAGGTMSGTLAMADNLITRPKFKDYGETVNAIGSIGGGTQDIDLTLGNVVSGTVDISATTFTFSNPPATGTAGSFTLILTNGGSQTVTWPASVDWAAATAPTLTAAGVDVLTFMTVDGGTIWYGFTAGLAMA